MFGLAAKWKRNRPDRLTRFFFLRRHFDHGCGQAQLLAREDGPTFLGSAFRRGKQLLAVTRTAAVHSVLGRPDALSLQLRLALEAGLVWGSLRWWSRGGGSPWA